MALRKNVILRSARRARLEGRTPADGDTRHSRREEGEALVGVEDVALDIIDDLGLAAERVHGAAEADPVEELLLAGILDFLGRQLAPAVELARAHLVEARAVAGVVGIEVMVLRRKERMRPTRRRNQRHPPRALCEGPRHRAADFEAALG